MKLNQEQYREMVEKLADEIVAETLEKTASGLVAAAPTGLNAIKSKKGLNKKLLGAAGVAGAVAAGAGALGAKAVADKKKEKEVEKEACEAYEYALRKIATAEAWYNDAVLEQEACIETLAEAGMYDENGFNKEAAEESQETVDFANEVSNIYNEATEKIAAAQEVYSESIKEAEKLAYYLTELGYEL